MIYIVPLVVAVVFLAACAVFCWLTREERVPLARLADPAPMPGDAAYGPFPVDTAPLLLLSESMAAVVALEREVREMCVAADRLIGPVQP